MPNTGRLYAPPTAAAAYRERYMRPYSTVSPPIGVAGLAANITAPPKGAVPPASYSRSSLSMRRSPDNEVSASYTTAYESRVRSRPIASYEDDRQWNNNYTEKQRGRTQQAWLDEEDEISVHHHASLSSISQLRSTEMTRQHRISSAPTYDSTPNMTNRASLESPHPSTLPRLSSLLKRGPADARHHESDEHFPTRKRAHEASPRRNSFEHEPKINRHFYEDDVFGDRRVPSKYNDGMWGGEEHVQESRVIRHEVTMPMKNPRSYGNSAQLDGRSQSSPLTSSRQYMEPARYPYMNNEANTASPREPIRRSSTRPDEQFTPRQGYEDRSKGYDMPRRSYYMPDEQRNEPSPLGLKSPTPSAVVRDRFSPVGRYSENKDADSVIEAAADLVEERSPSKRESITKLLLKSKEFLKAKSLVRNRNNEIDWVATFLNVGFESNSIYSLMCPLRKGRWKVEEEKYTMELLRLIESGVIRLRHGQSIRGFIAKKLHSDDMRVLKKLSNCKMFHFARLINPRMSDVEEIDNSIPNVRASLDRLEKLKAEFLRSVQLEALVAVRKYLSDTSIRDLLNARE